MGFTRMRGMKGFFALWLGQAFSLLGGSTAVFAITLWIYQRTGQATPVTLVGFFTLAPAVIIGPFAGALVDRYDRRLMMLLSDVASLCVSLFLILVSLGSSIDLWQIYLASAVLGVFQTFQWPAYSSAITLMIDKKHYARAASLMEMAGMSSGLVAPFVAGAFLGVIGLGGILGLTAIGSVLAILSLFLVELPSRPPAAQGNANFGGMLREIREALAYLFGKPALLGIQGVFLLGNFFTTLSFSLLGPMVLGRTANNAIAFATVEAAGALGGFAGTALIAISGGMKNRILGILVGWGGMGISGLLVLGLGRDLPFWIAGAFLGSAVGSLTYASNQSLWQSKVAPDLQGRVFALRMMIAKGVTPIANLIAGPLADGFLEPGMREGGSLVPIFGNLVGTGSGSGIALMFVFCGLALAIVALAGWSLPLIRHAERFLPDHAPMAHEPER